MLARCWASAVSADLALVHRLFSCEAGNSIKHVKRGHLGPRPNVGTAIKLHWVNVGVLFNVVRYPQ